MKVKDIARIIEAVAPLELQEDYDNAGLQIGNPEMEVSAIVTTLDVTEATLKLCKETGTNLIVSHHPLLFRGVKQISPQRDYISRVIIAAISHGVAIYSAHTNLDNAPEGVNLRLCQKLGLRNITHQPPLMMGELPEELNAEQFASLVCDVLRTPVVSTNMAEYCGRNVRKVAVCGGAGEDFIVQAERAGADAYVTGEVGYHLFFDHPNMLVVSAGHYETEQYTSQLLKNLILAAYPEAKVEVAGKSSPIEMFVNK